MAYRSLPELMRALVQESQGGRRPMGVSASMRYEIEYCFGFDDKARTTVLGVPIEEELEPHFGLYAEVKE